MIKRIIEFVALLLGLVITAGVVVAIPLKSYNEYKEYLAEIERQNAEKEQAAKKPVLESITVELKEGVRYFANDIAEARPEHFIVTANYTKEGEEPWSEPVEEDKFSVRTNADFYSNGGTITISYKNVSTTMEIALEPVVLEAIEIAVNPYTIKYQSGSTFDPAGMIVIAKYNDGTSKTLAADEYTVDTTKVLAAGDTAATVSFQDGEVIKTADVEIGVSETLNNGAVSSIVIVDGAIVKAGDTIQNATLEVNAVYENGNRRPLAADEYTVSGTVGAVAFGKTYHLTVTYNEDSSKSASCDVVVRQTLQGEDGIIVGGKANTETEYAVIDGVITMLDNTVSFAGNFAASVKKGEEGSLTLVLNSASETIGDITMRCSNSYNVYANGSNANEGYMMKPLQINTILDLTINGREVKVPATVVLRGCGPHESYAPLYGIYYEFTFEGVALDAGVNYVKFDFKNSTKGDANCWGESPSTLNIDYVHFDSLGSEIPDDYTIESIEISSGFTPEYSQRFDEITVPVLATLDNGSKIAIDSSLYDIEIIGGKEGDETFRFGKYTFVATMKDNPSLTASLEVEIPIVYDFVVLTAGIEVVGDKVQYVFTGNSLGYTADDIEFFDGGTVYPITVEFDEDNGTFRFYVDVTEAGYGLTYWPHLRLKGVNYNNGANANGDIRDRGIQFTNGQTLTFGDRRYTIVTQYSMPTLTIEKHIEIPVNPNPDPSVNYEAELNNSFTSDKANELVFQYGSAGVITNGKDQNAEYAGGIGNLDGIGKYIHYEFKLTEDGTIDIIWNIAGSKWNGTTQSNDGLEDMANYMTITIDGAPVDVSGIALPVGTGDNVWWNIQQVVIKGVKLEAGSHTFSCNITANGGLNVGSMVIKSDKTLGESDVVIPDEATIKSADIVVEGDKIYYTLTYNVSGYDPEKFEFFDADTIYEVESIVKDDTTVTFKINITDYTVGTTLWPHLRIAGVKWDGLNNTTSSNGDVKVPVDNKVLEHGGKTYTLMIQWDMPTVVVS